MKKSLLAPLILALALAVTPAEAHAHLKEAVPAVGSTIAAGPSELRLHFSEGIELAFSSVTVTMADGMKIAPKSVTLDSTDPALLVARFASPLAPGQYSVRWHAVSVDTHRTEGGYAFTVKP